MENTNKEILQFLKHCEAKNPNALLTLKDAKTFFELVDIRTDFFINSETLFVWVWTEKEAFLLNKRNRNDYLAFIRYMAKCEYVSTFYYKDVVLELKKHLSSLEYIV